MSKNEELKDVFKTRCWNGQVITDAYQVFAFCFSKAEIAIYRNFIEELILCSQENVVYNRNEPFDTIVYMKAIRSVILAAESLKDNKSPIEISSFEPLDKRYFLRHSEADVWSSFPRFLSFKEYSDPYLMFQKFFKLECSKDWTKVLKEVMEFALSIDSVMPVINTIKIYTYLSGLLEAAHLIDLREVVHIGGNLKTKFRK